MEVGITSVAQTSFEEKIANKNVADITYELTRDLLEDAGITRDEVDTVVEGSSDYWRGVACSNIFTIESTGGNLKELSKVEMDGAFAFAYAYMRILSGQFDIALVVSDTKCSEVMMPSSNIPNISADPMFQRYIGVDELSSAAMQAQEYMNFYDVSEEQISEVSVKNLNNARDNPNSHRKMEVDVEDVIESEMLSYPLRELHCPPYSDGACGVLLASEDRAKEMSDRPAWIAGIGWCHGVPFLGDRDLIDTSVLQSASEEAYEMAGIDNPLREIDVAEISEPYAHQELLWYEGMRLCKEGEGRNLLEEGVTRKDGDLPVNPSGGVISSNPHVVRGLVRIAEAALQVRGDAGERQVQGAEKSVAHATRGFAGQEHIVTCLSSEVSHG